MRLIPFPQAVKLTWMRSSTSYPEGNHYGKVRCPCQRQQCVAKTASLHKSWAAGTAVTLSVHYSTSTCNYSRHSDHRTPSLHTVTSLLVSSSSPGLSSETIHPVAHAGAKDSLKHITEEENYRSLSDLPPSNSHCTLLHHQAFLQPLQPSAKGLLPWETIISQAFSQTKQSISTGSLSWPTSPPKGAGTASLARLA